MIEPASPADSLNPESVTDTVGLSMHTIHHAGHSGHDPARLNHPACPPSCHYWEVAERAERLIEAIRGARLGPVHAPDDLGTDPLAAVHSAELLGFLERAAVALQSDAAALEGNAAAPTPALVPETYPLGVAEVRSPASLRGQLGLYTFDTSSPLLPGTREAVYWAAQSALTGARAILQGTPCALALCRPPGHHAGPTRFGGFCYLNSAAIAAEWLTASNLRTAVVDIDYHHGNGTQEIFYERSDVLFCSLHADPMDEFPFYWGHADERGRGTGEGFNLNFPLAAGTGEPSYLAALDAAIRAVVAFAPDALVVSLGVDTAEDDPLGCFELTDVTFSRVGERLARLSRPTLIVMEGGYALSTLGDHVLAFARGFLDG